MSHSSVNVILHLSGDLADTERASIAQAISAERGVSKVQPSPKAERLILVDYDPIAISAQRILSSVRARGVRAQLVGM